MHATVSSITRNIRFLKEAEKWSASVEKNIDIILSIKPKKLKKLSPDKVEELDGIVLFQKLGVEIEFLTFKSLLNEYMRQWTGKAAKSISRAEFWTLSRLGSVDASVTLSWNSTNSGNNVNPNPVDDVDLDVRYSTLQLIQPTVQFYGR